MVQAKTSGEMARILLVEDNDDHAYLVRYGIESVWEDVILHHVTGAEDAINFMRDMSSPLPDLVLLDLIMPGANGFDFLMAVKLHSCWRQIPVVVLTTSLAPEDRTHAYKNHANSYIVKPEDAAGYRHIAQELHRYWYNFNQPTGDKPTHLPLPPRHS